MQPKKDRPRTVYTYCYFHQGSPHYIAHNCSLHFDKNALLLEVDWLTLLQMTLYSLCVFLRDAAMVNSDDSDVMLGRLALTSSSALGQSCSGVFTNSCQTAGSFTIALMYDGVAAIFAFTLGCARMAAVSASGVRLRSVLNEESRNGCHGQGASKDIMCQHLIDRWSCKRCSRSWPVVSLCWGWCHSQVEICDLLLQCWIVHCLNVHH